MALDVARTILELAHQAEQQKQRDMLQRRTFAVRLYSRGTDMRDVVSMATDKGCVGSLKVAFNHTGGVQASYQVGSTGRLRGCTKPVTLPYEQLQYLVRLMCVQARQFDWLSWCQDGDGKRRGTLRMALFQLSQSASHVESISNAEVVVRYDARVDEVSVEGEVLKLLDFARSVQPDP